MRLGSKHTNQQTVRFDTFTGGLNTTHGAELIAQNELSKSVNFQIDTSTGQLKTVEGTDQIFTDNSKHFTDILYDSIGNTMLLVDTDKVLYSLNGSKLTSIGAITGSSNIAYAAWEDGLIIASGRYLQYYHGGQLDTLNGADAPAVAHGAFVKDGRVWTYTGDEIHTSAVGDETSWETNANDASSAQWFQIGYKDGGYITGVCSLSSDVIVFKSNHHAYHIAGQIPDISVIEIGREIECKIFNSCISLANTALTVGTSSINSISTTDAYGDMKASNIGLKVSSDIASLGDIKLRYMPALNQVWILTGLNKFLFLDLNYGSYFHRFYNKPIVDAVSINDKIYLLKEHGVYTLSSSHFTDDGEWMPWEFQAKTIFGINPYLIKRFNVDLVQLSLEYAENKFTAGSVVIRDIMPTWSLGIYHDKTSIYHNKRPIYNVPIKALYSSSEEVYDNPEEIFCSQAPLRGWDYIRGEVRCVDRKRAIKVFGYGRGAQMLLNGMSIDVAEV